MSEEWKRGRVAGNWGDLHVPDVEQARLFTCPIVRVDDAQVAVLHGHLVAAKGHEPGAVLCMELVESGLAQLTLDGGRRG